MVDIPYLIKRKREKETNDYLMQMQLQTATNNRVMEDESYQKLIRNLTKGFEEGSKKQNNDKNEFDRHKFEVLRFMTNRGANFTGRG